VFVAWRHPAGTDNAQAVLAAALSQILAAPVGAPVYQRLTPSRQARRVPGLAQQA
jgi:hypothetical protein